MDYRTLGHSDIRVSALSLGTMTFGEQNDRGQSFALMDQAFEAGINLFDVAELYPVPPKAETQGASECLVGQWIAERGCRNNIVLATKVCGPNPDLPWFRGGAQLTRNHIHQAVEDSLKRLQTDCIDLYQVHWPARHTNFFGQLGFRSIGEEQATPIIETLEALEALVIAGKVRTIGLSNETPWGLMQYLQLAKEHGLSRVVAVQNPYNLLNRSYEVGLAEMSAREQVGLLAYSPLAFGVLTGKYLHNQQPANARLTRWQRFDRYSNDQAQWACERYVQLANTLEITPEALALAFIRQQPFVTSVILGATTPQQLQRNIAGGLTQLDKRMLDHIDSIHRQQPNPAP